MIYGIDIRHFTGVSVLALVAALSIQDEVMACSADTSGAASGDGVTVVCGIEDQARDFQTSFSGFSPDTDYDGNDPDRVVILGGTILPTEESTPFDSSAEIFLDESSGNQILTLGGDDQFNINAGAVGSATQRVDILLGDGNDGFTSEGGDIYGDVFGGAGNDQFAVSGGTLHFGLFGEDGDDAFNLTGGQILGPVEGGAGIDSFSVSDSAFISGYVSGDAGDDQFTIEGGSIGGTIFGGADDDTIIISGGSIGGVVFAGSGDDIVIISGTADIVADGAEPDGIGLEDGDDQFTMTGGTVGAAVSGGAGADVFDISGGTISTFVAGNEGGDEITVSGTAAIGAHITAGDGDDLVTIQGGSVGTFVDGGSGVDTISVENGTIAGDIYGGDDGDAIEISGGTVGGAVFGHGGDGVDGNDMITVSGGSVATFVDGGDGDDAITVSGTGEIGAYVAGGAGADTLTVLGGAIAAYLEGGTGDDMLVVSAGTIGGDISGGAGGDTIEVSGAGEIGGDVRGGAGDDTIDISGGSIDGSILGEDGDDRVAVRGGRIGGGIEAETVHLSGGTIGGDITGLSGNTLTISDATTLDLRDGVLFSGTNAVGEIGNTDLARFGGGTFESQNFLGFSSLTATNSTLGFDNQQQVIDQLSLDGSTLYLNGTVEIASQGGGLGNVTASNSTITMADGDTNDVLRVGDMTLLGGVVLAIDVDQTAGSADQIFVGGAFVASGANIIQVNLAGIPVFVGFSEIPIITTGDTDVAAAFTVEPIPATAAELFSYEIVPGGDGLVLRISPGDLTPITGPVAPVNSQTVGIALDTIDDIRNRAAEFALGFAGGGVPVQISPTFGVFASGQFARVEHDGFGVSNGSFLGFGPSFDANDFSAAISLDFNAAKHFEFDDKYGLNIGLFAGYTSTDVTQGPFLSFPSVGSATNESGMIGLYGLFRQGLNYALVSATTFIGETDVTNSVLNSTGSYDTVGYAVTASAGHIFLLSDNLRFDLRGGIVGVTFQGNGFTDSQGNVFGDSEISFGAVKFDPGIYGEYRFENGMVFSPYARVELQQRFGYENTASVAGIDFDFDDSDFSASLSGGFNLKVSTSATVSAEVRGKASSDSTTVAGKIGLKMAF